MSENKVKAELAGWESFILLIIMFASVSTCSNTALTKSYMEEMKNDVKEIKELVQEHDSTFAVHND
jgi:hypothetical protein